MTATHSARNGAVDEMRGIARRLESANPLWIVVFGIYTREFVAFPRFAEGAFIAATYPEALPGRMRQVERMARIGLEEVRVARWERSRPR